MAIHIIMVCCWKNDFYIYKGMGAGLYILGSGNVLYSIYVNFYRILIGLTGSISWIYILQIISRLIKQDGVIHKNIKSTSKYSIGIYVISVYVLNEFLRDMTWLNYSIFLIIAETMMIMIISKLFMQAIDKWTVSRKFLLGGR